MLDIAYAEAGGELGVGSHLLSCRMQGWASDQCVISQLLYLLIHLASLQGQF